MRKLVASMVVAAAGTMPAQAQEPFDACDVFTQADAEKALGVAVAGEPVNPKVRRPKVVTSCTYTATSAGKPVVASAQFKFAKSEPDLQRAFEDHRLQVQTKPMLISGADAFWSAKTGQLNLRKGRTWVVVSVGAQKAQDRDLDASRKVAEILAKKL